MIKNKKFLKLLDSLKSYNLSTINKSTDILIVIDNYTIITKFVKIGKLNAIDKPYLYINDVEIRLTDSQTNELITTLLNLINLNKSCHNP